ncbi:ABC transporter ATP-binding protein [uncultured Enterovirga sp.]|uniref:ABC transporter ATP-binding protein n=1 Tax=uncultured Enterovirga sp. TaxID=2026352 RepID=UPI0035CBF700
MSLGTAAAGQAAAAPSSYLDIAGVTKSYGSVTVLENLHLGVNQGEFVSLLGPSGCGKTTLLRLVAGLIAADGGRIMVGGRDLTRVPAHKRKIGVVFQSYALFPHLTVAENVAFGLRAQRAPRGEISARVRDALALVRMESFADRAITALSGGQQQRIAVARALVVKPALLLLDEPFSALDRNLRETMQIELRRLLRDLGITSIFVTHDQDEALVMSDRIAVMREGKIEHLGSPAEIYSRPRSLYVLEFVGQSTRIAGQVASAGGGSVTVETAFGAIQAPGNFLAGSPVAIGVRPEAMLLGAGPDGGYNNIRAKVLDIVFLGAKTTLLFAAERSGDRLMVELARLPPGVEPGADAAIRWRIEDTMVYPAP